MIVMQLRYRFRLYPDGPQRAALAQAFGCARVVFNDALRAREDARAAGLPYVTQGQLSKALTASKKTPERAWLNEVSAVVLQQSLRDLDAAYRYFFDGLEGKRSKVGVPRMKSRKKSHQSVRFTRGAFKVTDGGRLRLARIGEVRVRWSRALPSPPSSVAVVKDSAGRYFCSFAVNSGPGEALPPVSSEVGIDLGLTHFAVLSDGEKIASPRFLRRAEKKLKRAQRSLARKKPGSSNREKARHKVARVNARVADARRDFHHQLSTRIIRENQAVAVETLPVEKLVRTRLGKSVRDAGWSAFVDMLEYKAARYGRTFTKIGRYEQTSQTCSVCHVNSGPKALDIRKWTCPACGALLDRDVNAAINIATAAGLAVTACGARVRPGLVPAPRHEAGTHPKPRRQAARQAGVALR